jgi:hypothetical protein
MKMLKNILTLQLIMVWFVYIPIAGLYWHLYHIAYSQAIGYPVSIIDSIGIVMLIAILLITNVVMLVNHVFSKN